jgi:hypothetical protein
VVLIGLVMVDAARTAFGFQEPPLGFLRRHGYSLSSKTITQSPSFAWLDADAGVESDHVGLVGNQRIEAKLLDRRAVDHELRQPGEGVGDRRKAAGRLSRYPSSSLEMRV